MNLNLRFVRRAVPFCAAVLVSSCGVVGKGLVPNKLLITTGGLTQPNAVRAYQCVSGALHGIITFTDGEAADFTGRAPLVWSSSNSSVAKIDANTGVIQPEQAGTTTITATYYTLKASIELEVSALSPSDLSLQKLDQENYSPINTTNGITIATNTNDTSSAQYAAPATQLVALVANESANGGSTVARNVSAAATFSISSGGITITDGTGTTTSGNIGGLYNSTINAYQLSGDASTTGSPYTLTATLGACDSHITISTQVYVSNVQSLTLSPEADPASGPALGFTDPTSGNPLPLVKGYGAERLKLVANFMNGQSQDISLIGKYTSSDPTVADFNFANYSAVNSADILSALSSSATPSSSTGLTTPTNVSATFTDGTDVPMTSNILPFQVLDAGTLTSLAIAPTTGSATATSSVDSVQFYGIGTFTSGTATTNQSVTRLTTFTPADTTIATINSYPSVYSGLAFPGTTTNTTTDQMTTISASTTIIGTTPTTLNAGNTATFTLLAQPDAP